MTENRLISKHNPIIGRAKTKTNNLLFLMAALFIWTVTNSPLSAQQVFGNDYPPTREFFPFFNSSYIKDNNIKSLHTKVMYKSPMQQIEKSVESDHFSFNMEGVVTSHQQISGLGDTILTHFKVNTLGLVSEMQEINKHRNVVISNTYNDHNDLVKTVETDFLTKIELQKQEYKFIYEYYDQYKKYWLNDEGISYKYSIIKLDDKNRIIEEKGRYLRGTSKHAIYFTYQEDKLMSYSSNIRETTRKEKKYQMIYNDSGVLVEMNEYKDGAYIHHHEFLYEDGLLVAILEKRIRNQRIKIIKIKYEFVK